MASAPTLKEPTNTDAGDATKWDGPDAIHCAELIKGTHSTEKIQSEAIDRVGKANDTATVAPDEDNDNTEGYSIGSRWFDVTADKIYTAIDVSTGAAIWELIGVIRTINFLIDGGGSVITTGIKGQIVIDYDCIIEEWAIIGLPAGAIVVDVHRSTYAGFPTTATLTASEKPTISATNDTGEDRALTTWSAINAGDILEFIVDSVATIERCTVALKARLT